MWMLLMWMSNVSLHTLLCCHHKIKLMARETHDGWTQHQSPSDKRHKTVQTTIHTRSNIFSLPGHWKATKYILILPKLHYYRTLCCYLKWLDSKELSSDKASEPEAWSQRPVTNGNPAASMMLLLYSGQNLNSVLKF